MPLVSGTSAAVARASPSSLYHGRTMAGPMVRISSLAFRVLCANQGADVVFSEEMVAAKLAKATREVVVYDVPKSLLVGSGDLLSVSVDSVERDATVAVKVVEFVVYERYKSMIKRQVVFATIDRGSSCGEGCPVIAQLGAAEPALAAAAAAVVCEDVDGIDVNMGCPKKFSIENGMGAALMSDPKRAGAILHAIDASVNSDTRLAARENRRRIAISFKTRLFADPAVSVSQLRDVVHSAGGVSCVHAISLHARTRDQRSETAPLYDLAQDVVRRCRDQEPALFADMCFVFNGSVSCRGDGESFLKAQVNSPPSGSAVRGFEGILISRHAMWDPSSFRMDRREQGPTFIDPSASLEHILRVYRTMILMHRFYRTNFTYLKYHMTRSFQEFPVAKKGLHPRMQSARTYGAFAEILGIPTQQAQAMFGSTTFEELMPCLPTSAGATVVGGPTGLPPPSSQQYQQCGGVRPREEEAGGATEKDGADASVAAKMPRCEGIQ